MMMMVGEKWMISNNQAIMTNPDKLKVEVKRCSICVTNEQCHSTTRTHQNISPGK